MLKKFRKIATALVLSVSVLTATAAPVAAAEQTTVAATATKAGWKTVKGVKYYYGTNGKVKKGWLTLKGKKYYLDPAKKGAMTTGAKKISGKWYCFTKAGVLVVKKYGYKAGKYYYKINAKGVATKLTTVQGKAGAKLDSLNGSLANAFKWSAKLRYYGNSTTIPSGKTATQYYGEYGFNYNRGDCNVQAATFYWMAKALGYNVKFVQGYVPQANNTFGPHAWCEIVRNGKTYVFDPNLSSRYGLSRGYKFTYGTKGTYQYYDKNKKKITKK